MSETRLIPASLPEESELLILELDSRLELGVPMLSSDLDGDSNSLGCTNGVGCSGTNSLGVCSNTKNCGS